MKNISLALVLFFLLPGIFAREIINIGTITSAAPPFTLRFTTPQKGSMPDELKDNGPINQKTHRMTVPGSLVYPFVFNPAPATFVMPARLKAIHWQMPENISFPQNKNKLAFSSIAQLKSLVKNKKISSADLMKLFSERVKKSGGTPGSVMNFTEELAMLQVRQADDSVKDCVKRNSIKYLDEHP